MYWWSKVPPTPSPPSPRELRTQMPPVVDVHVIAPWIKERSKTTHRTKCAHHEYCTCIAVVVRTLLTGRLNSAMALSSAASLAAPVFPLSAWPSVVLVGTLRSHIHTRDTQPARSKRTEPTQIAHRSHKTKKVRHVKAVFSTVLQ